MNAKRCLVVAAVVGTLHFSTANGQATRTERDLLGPKEVPADAYYGVQTMRGLENFQISGMLINHYPGFVEALGGREARGGAREHARSAP